MHDKKEEKDAYMRKIIHGTPVYSIRNDIHLTYSRSMDKYRSKMLSLTTLGASSRIRGFKFDSDKKYPCYMLNTGILQQLNPSNKAAMYTPYGCSYNVEYTEYPECKKILYNGNRRLDILKIHNRRKSLHYNAVLVCPIYENDD